MSAGPALVVPQFVAGAKKNLIGGEWADAASGRRIEVLNPATGDSLCSIAQGDAEDVDRAVAVARRAFEGEWRRWTPRWRLVSVSPRDQRQPQP
ncbi:aldehyde dehydrogenase family protein [Amycolatopsis sp. NPDC004079]|uniref:aldehyde dehydrogenase family protein n=1 Tax=Amycolatopsis sp. NPDC004079 TaxID=3154549 RepID=UPI0033AF75E8